MRLHVVSDVHGNAEALRRAGDGADALLVLGDLVDFVDYHDPAGGILGRVLGPEVSARFGRLRSSGRPGELVAYVRAQWERLPDAAGVIEDAVREQYAELFAALTAPTWAIPGNVDLPHLWPEYARPGLCLPDGRVEDVCGIRVGFVGGAPLPPGREPLRGGPWHPHVLRADEYAAAVHRLGPLDLLCSHVPPAVPEQASAPRTATGPARPCSDTCTSRWPRACGSGAPSASTSATSSARACPTCCGGR